MATKRVRMTPLMEGEKRQKKKQKHPDAPNDGSEEEAEAKGGTREGGEEEAGMSNSCASSDSYQASAMLAALERKWMVPTMSNPSAIAPKIWCDQHLLRILAKGRNGFFPALSRGRNVLNLCLPCPDRAILSLGETQCFGKGCGPFTPIFAPTISLPKAQSHWQ